MRHPDEKFLLRMAAADAAAMPMEFVDPKVHPETLEACLRMEGYVAHPTFAEYRPGSYTDDTEMTMANARVLLARGGPWSCQEFASAYVNEYRRGGNRYGYSRGFREILERVRLPRELLQLVNPNSKGNGAAMRAIPFGLLPLREGLAAAEAQARVTHDMPAGRFSARMIALMAHFAFHEAAPLSALPAFCLSQVTSEERRHFGGALSTPWPQEAVVKAPGRESLAVQTVRAVLFNLTYGLSLHDMFVRAIRWGGDTDTVAALSWGIASCRFPHEELPAFMARDLEGGDPNTGAPALLALGRQLMGTFS